MSQSHTLFRIDCYLEYEKFLPFGLRARCRRYFCLFRKNSFFLSHISILTQFQWWRSTNCNFKCIFFIPKLMPFPFSKIIKLLLTITIALNFIWTKIKTKWFTSSNITFPHYYYCFLSLKSNMYSNFFLMRSHSQKNAFAKITQKRNPIGSFWWTVYISMRTIWKATKNRLNL